MSDIYKSNKTPGIKFTQGEAMQKIRELDESTLENINELLSITNEINGSNLVQKGLSTKEKENLDQINGERILNGGNILSSMSQEVKDILFAIVYWRDYEKNNIDMKDEYNKEIEEVMGGELVDDWGENKL